MTRIYFDVESIPDQSRTPEDFRELVHPPANYKKQDTIDKWWATEGNKAMEDAYTKTALDPSYGELVCICGAVGDEPVEAFWRAPGGAETDIIEGFQTWAKDKARGQLIEWAGHNVTFDLEYLWKRCMIHRIEPLFYPWKATPWNGRYLDTMYEWGGAKKKISLKELCRILGIEIGDDDDLDGSEVWGAWQAGEIEKIATHCTYDVERVREIVRLIK